MDEDDDIFDEFERGEKEVGVMDSTGTRTVDVDGNVGHSSGQSTTETKANNVKEKRKRKEVSHMWKYFVKIQKEGEEPRAECKHCGSRFMAHSHKHGTSSLNKHIRNCKILNQMKGAMDSFVISHDGDGSKNQMRMHKFDPKQIREKLVE
ncbi:hypothetical protein Dimus_025373 [Dionaea muscipula]